MAIKDGFDEPINISEPGPVVGRQYELILEEIRIYEKVVAYTDFTKNLRLPDGKSVLGRQYDELPANIREMIDSAPDEYRVDAYGNERKREKYINRIMFLFREPTTNWPLPINFDMSYPDSRPTGKLSRWVTRVVGIPIVGDEGFRWGDLFKKGEKFTGKIGRDKRGWKCLEPDTIEKVGSVQINIAPGGLSDDAKALLGFIKQNLVGQPISVMSDYLASGANGVIQGATPEETYSKTLSAWSEIKANTRYTLDGVTFGFDS